MTAPALLLTATLSFHVPTLDAPGDDSTHKCYDIAAAVLYRSVQSRTWLDSSAVMLRDSLAWSRLWPRVRAEAAQLQIMSVGLTYRDMGALKSFTVADTLHGNFVVRTRDASGNESRDSNWSGR